MLGALSVIAAVDQAERGRPLSAGTLGILATLTHPDHAIFYACLGLALAARAAGLRAAAATLGRYGVPLVAIYVPYFVWRYGYYGDVFPNTYYSKNASLSYFSQGARYLGLSGISTGLLAVLPAAVWGSVVHRQSVLARFCWLSVPAFCLYVGKIGGDFMLGRLLCPLLPPLYVLAELGLGAALRRPGPRARRLALGALLVSCTAIVPVRFIGAREIYAQVADERTYYPVASYLPFRLDNAYWHWAHAFEEAFEGLSRKPTLAMFSVGIVGYETELRLVDRAGLTHRRLAHWKNRQRGRPGHEKLMPPGLLVQTDADFADARVYPEPYAELGRMQIGGVAFYLVRHDASLIGELVDDGHEPPPLLAYLDEYAPADSPHRLACDLWYLQQIHFGHERDDKRRRAIVERVLRARPELRGYRDFALGEPGPEHPAWQSVARLGFDVRAAAASRRGSAFAGSPSARERSGQSPAAGAVGAYLNSYTEADAGYAAGS
jgi:hypothetical protein